MFIVLLNLKLADNQEIINLIGQILKHTTEIYWSKLHCSENNNALFIQ